MDCEIFGGGDALVAGWEGECHRALFACEGKAWRLRSNKRDMRCDGFRQKNGQLKAGAGGEYEAADDADAA